MKDKNYTVYKHTSPNGKVYIGITSQTVNHRWNNGNGYMQCTVFFKAIQKYGWENIKHEILYKNLDKEEAEQKEKELIAEYKSNQREYGYNLLEGGGVFAKHSPESIEKMRIAKLGKKMSEETKKKRSIINKKMWENEEYRKHMTEIMKGNTYSLGKHHTEEWKQKVSEKLKGKNNPNYGKKQTEEMKKRISEHTKNKKPVIQLTKDNKFVKMYSSIKQAERETGVANPNIVACCKGKKQYAGGYIWQYASQYL